MLRNNDLHEGESDSFLFSCLSCTSLAQVFVGLGGLEGGELFFGVNVHAHWGWGFLNAFSTWRLGLDMTKTKSLIWVGDDSLWN